jgi:hypothetical protein
MVNGYKSLHVSKPNLGPPPKDSHEPQSAEIPPEARCGPGDSLAGHPAVDRGVFLVGRMARDRVCSGKMAGSCRGVSKLNKLVTNLNEPEHVYEQIGSFCRHGWHLRASRPGCGKEASAQTLTTLHSLGGPDASVREAGLVFDAAGALYGTTGGVNGL